MKKVKKLITYKGIDMADTKSMYDFLIDKKVRGEYIKLGQLSNRVKFMIQDISLYKNKIICIMTSV